MNIESFLKEKMPLLEISTHKIHIAPDIPEKKLNGAVSAIAKDVDPSHIIALVDSTLFGSGREGLIFLGDCFYSKYAGEIIKINYKDLAKVSMTSVGDTSAVSVELNDGKIITLKSEISYINKEEFNNLFNEIIDKQKDADVDFQTTSQTQPLFMMDVSIKEAYFKMLCNFCFSDDDQVDSEEYAAIMNLMVINDVPKEVRLKMRSYIYNNDSIISNDELIKVLEESVEAGSVDTVKISVFKDTINLYVKKTHNYNWTDSKYIKSLQKELNITDEKAIYVAETIIENEKILTERKTDVEIKKTMSELAAKAGAVGVPLVAIYFSGSVIGVGATGITSGLAALGMGGVLGFSGMLTGLGVVALLGVGAYKGIKKVTGMGDIEKNKQREAMLQEIAKNTQKALNYTIEDINEIAKQLQEEIIKGKMNDAKVKKLSALMSRISQGAASVGNHLSYASKEEILCKMPIKISVAKLEELTAPATKKPYKEIIYTAYTENEERAEEETTAFVYLDTSLSLETLEKVYDALDAVGFYNTVNSTMASAKSFFKSFTE